MLARDFSLKPAQMVLAFAAGLATQALWLHAKGLQQKGFLSAFVTCFGLSILLRSDTLWVHPLAACLAMSAKFVIRVNGKHLYNPANLGVILATTLFPGTWISPGQWGNELAVAVWFVALGGVVVQRARRWDIAWFFLGGWLGLVALRVLWLGQPWSVWAHQLGSGALLLFAFFMISDPMTIPNRRGARVAYALVVAAVAFGWQYVLFRPNALVWALFVATPWCRSSTGCFRRRNSAGGPTGWPARDPPSRAADAYSSSCLRCLANSLASCCCSIGGAGS